MSLVTIKHLWKEYGDNVVLENLSLNIEAGEFCTLVGPSGCGKTTFLKMLLGQENPSRGTFLLDGEPFPTEPGVDRGIVFQRYSVFEHLSVLNNVMRPKPALWRCSKRSDLPIRQTNFRARFRVGCSSVSPSHRRL